MSGSVLPYHPVNKSIVPNSLKKLALLQEKASVIVWILCHS
ncbi:MAG: hypothetical protein ACRYE8_02895 [Janthinobacterium lividum]